MLERVVRVAVAVTLFVFLLTGSMAWALFDDNSTDQDQSQGQGQLQGQAQGQLQGQAQGQAQAAIAAQGQLQGQSATQGNTQNIGGDSTKAYANAWPSLSGGEGVSQANAYSVFGGLGLSNTEPYKAYITQIQAIEASTVLDAETKQIYVSLLTQKMYKENKKQRFLGLFWETSGRNLLNLFGVLSWDSFWAEGQHPFVKAENGKILYNEGCIVGNE